MRRSNKKGFTIVELVIVIAVIAILAAVMIPTFTGVTKNANEQANKADAKAAYTDYVAKDIKNADADFIIKSSKGGEKYYYVVDGKFDVANVKDTLDEAKAAIKTGNEDTTEVYVWTELDEDADGIIEITCDDHKAGDGENSATCPTCGESYSAPTEE